MILKRKDETPFGGFTFEFVFLDGKPGRVESTGLKQLVLDARIVLDRAGIAFPPNLTAIIEHQICLRQPDPKEACYSSGGGDDLHWKFVQPMMKKVSEKVALINASPGTSKTVKAALNIVGRLAESIGSCEACKGKNRYVQGENNLGRAGVLNRFLGGKSVD